MMMLLLIESWCRTATERSASAAGKVVSFSFFFQEIFHVFIVVIEID